MARTGSSKIILIQFWLIGALGYIKTPSIILLIWREFPDWKTSTWVSFLFCGYNCRLFWLSGIRIIFFACLQVVDTSPTYR
jgi:hypothetical protein